MFDIHPDRLSPYIEIAGVLLFPIFAYLNRRQAKRTTGLLRVINVFTSSLMVGGTIGYALRLAILYGRK